MHVDEHGFITARATVVPFRPEQDHPFAVDVSERDGGGRFVVTPACEGIARERLYQGVTVRFHPADQFATIVADEECSTCGALHRDVDCFGEPVS